MRPLIIICLLWIQCSVLAQSTLPEIPDSLILNTAEDYRKLDRQVEKCLKWLCTAPYGQDIIYRSEANAFVLIWLAGTPDYVVNIDSKRLQYGQYSEMVMLSFIHAKAYLMMSRGGKWEEKKLELEAMRIVCALIASSEKMSKDKVFRSLLKAFKKNQLEEYLDALETQAQQTN
jgi:hypothetical protein